MFKKPGKLESDLKLFLSNQFLRCSSKFLIDIGIAFNLRPTFCGLCQVSFSCATHSNKKTLDP